MISAAGANPVPAADPRNFPTYPNKTQHYPNISQQGRRNVGVNVGIFVGAGPQSYRSPFKWLQAKGTAGCKAIQWALCEGIIMHNIMQMSRN